MQLVETIREPRNESHGHRFAMLNSHQVAFNIEFNNTIK